MYYTFFFDTCQQLTGVHKRYRIEGTFFVCVLRLKRSAHITKEEVVVARYIIKGHAIERFCERVCGEKKDIKFMTQEEVDDVKHVIRKDLSLARELVGAERMVMLSRVQFVSHGKARRQGGKYFSRADTDILRYEDRVYFVRSGTRVVVSMMRLNDGMMKTMADLSPQDESVVPQAEKLDDETQHSDLREIRNSAFIVLTRNVFSMMQTVLGWYHHRAISELRKILSDPRAILPTPILTQLFTAYNHEALPQTRYVLHAHAHVVVGVRRRPVRPGDNAHSLSWADEIVDLVFLTPEQCTFVLTHLPRAVYGSFDSIIECSQDVFDRLRIQHGWSMQHTYAFIVEQFRDPATHLIDLDREPCAHYDLPEAHIECYEAPACYLWFEGARVLDCVLTDEAQWAYSEKPRATQ